MTLSGGPVLWILGLLGVVSVFTFLGRLLDLHRAQIDYQDFIKGVVNILSRGNVDEAIAVCEDTAVPVANVVATAIRHIGGNERMIRESVDSQGRAEAGRLDRRLGVLALIGQVTPLIGLLGTIFGFIRTLMLVNSQELVSRAELLDSAVEALVAAAMGLVVAIPVVVMYGSLRLRMDRIVVELEAAASQIVGYVVTCGETKAAEAKPAAEPLKAEAPVKAGEADA